MAFRSDVWLCRQTIPQCSGISSIVCVSPIINNLLPRTLPFVPIYWAVTLDSGLMRLVFQVLSCVTTGSSVWYAWGPARVAQSSRAFLSPSVHTSSLPSSLTQSCRNCCVSSLGWEATSCKGARIGNQMKTRVWWSRRCDDLQPTKRWNNQPIRFNMAKTLDKKQSKNKPHPATQWWSKHLFWYKHRQKLCTARQREHYVSSI